MAHTTPYIQHRSEGLIPETETFDNYAAYIYIYMMTNSYLPLSYYELYYVLYYD